MPAGSGLIALADAVARRSGRPAGEVMRLLMEARDLPAPSTPGTAEDVEIHLRAVRALGDLLTAGGGQAIASALPAGSERRTR